jgi:hypothetical protein
MNEEIRALRRRIRKAERTWRKRILTVDFQVYHELLRSLSFLLKKSKRVFYSEKIADCGNDARALYLVVNNLMGKSDVPLLPMQRADKCVAEEFNDYFSSKISSIRSFLDNLAESRKSDHTELEAFFLSLHGESCYLDRLSPVSVGTVTEIILATPVKSCCLDPLPTPLMKKFLSVLAVPITRMANASLVSGLVPDSLKHAAITPLIKKSSLIRRTSQTTVRCLVFHFSPN